MTARNYGYALQRLDPQTGKSLWPEEVLVSLDSLAAEDTAVDAEAVYFVSRNILQARALKDGKLLWKLPLTGPPGRWRALLERGSLLAFPVESSELQCHLGWFNQHLSLNLTLPPQEHGQPSFPVVVCDPKTGRLTQRLNFSNLRPLMTVQCSPNPPIDLLPYLWIDRWQPSRMSPTVHMMERGMVIAANREMWRVIEASSE